MYDQQRYVKTIQIREIKAFFGLDHDETIVESVQKYLVLLSCENVVDIVHLNVVLCENKGEIGAHVYTAAVMPYQKIISDGDTGFIAGSEQEWIDKINQLIADPQLRKDMGNNGFKLAWEDPSYTPKTIPRLKSIFV